MGIDSPWSCCGDCPDRKCVVCLELGGPRLVRTKYCWCGVILQSARSNLESLSIAHFLQSIFTCGPYQHQCLVLEFCKVDHDTEQSIFSRFGGFWIALWQQSRGTGDRAVRDLPHVPCVQKESNSPHVQNWKIFPVLLVANCNLITELVHWLLTLKSFSHFTLRVTSFPTLSSHKFTILIKKVLPSSLQVPDAQLAS